MSYDTVEGAIQAILQGLTSEFANTAQVTRGDWRVMDGGYDQVAVLYAGGFAETEDDQEQAINEFGMNWTVKLDLIRRYLDDGTTRQNFAKSRDAILNELIKYPNLHALAGSTARRGPITSDTDVEPIVDETSQGPLFLMQTISIPVFEVLSVSPTG